MKTTVIYHSADFDGIFCREIARKFLPPDTEFIGWDFADCPLSPGRLLVGDTVYVLDLPVDRVFGMTLGAETPAAVFDNVVWIDHHKTSIDTHPKALRGYRIDGVAACRLAWQWFSLGYQFKPLKFVNPTDTLPTAEQFKNREVSEPRAVRLAGEYDVWDKRDPDAEVFQFALRAKMIEEEDWSILLGSEPTGFTAGFIEAMLENGSLLQRYQQERDAGAMRSAFILAWHGMKFLTLNQPKGFNSLTFASSDVPETGHDALMGFGYDGKVWRFSLYHAKHRTDIDLSEIAKQFGGGGHRGACGFSTDYIPFTLESES